VQFNCRCPILAPAHWVAESAAQQVKQSVSTRELKREILCRVIEWSSIPLASGNTFNCALSQAFHPGIDQGIHACVPDIKKPSLGRLHMSFVDAYLAN